MTSSNNNRVSQSTTVTPDCVIQLTGEHGIVAELKASLCRDHENWKADIKQLEKYDDLLNGWWTPDESLGEHDIAALVPIERSVQFADVFEKTAGDRFERKTAVIGFFRHSRENEFLTLKKERGALSDSDLDERLRQSVSIRWDRLIAEYGDRKFVEQAPPLLYLLQVIWDHVLSRYAATAPYNESKKARVFTIGVSQVTADLQEDYGFKSAGARSPGVPRPGLVRSALNILVHGKHAVIEAEDSYTIFYRKFKQDSLQKFGKLCHALQLRLIKKRRSSGGDRLLPGFEEGSSPKSAE